MILLPPLLLPSNLHFGPGQRFIFVFPVVPTHWLRQVASLSIICEGVQVHSATICKPEGPVAKIRGAVARCRVLVKIRGWKRHNMGGIWLSAAEDITCGTLFIFCLPFKLTQVEHGNPLRLLWASTSPLRASTVVGLPFERTSLLCHEIPTISPPVAAIRSFSSARSLPFWITSSLA